MSIDPMANVRFRRRACAGLLLLCACLLAATCAKRLDCPACAADALAENEGCPFEATGFTAMSAPITDPTLLVLSGGGSHGAFGAGVIYGWEAQHPAGTRPHFTIVTGISTGALQATHAFLGNRDAELETIFTSTSNGMVFTPNSNPLGSNALQTREPLKALIDKYVTDAAIVEVAQQAGRELWVGTVNLDTSQFCPWNLSAVAREAKAAGSGTTQGDCYFDLFRDVIWAASGAPVVAPPVPLDAGACQTGAAANPKAALHVDGGARLRVFAEEILAPVISSSGPKIYVIVNGKTVLHPICVVDWIGAIAHRTFEMANEEAMLGSLLFLDAKFPSGWNLQLSRVPDDYCLEFPPSEFDPAAMKKLFEKGKDWAKTLAWEPAVPEARVAPWPAGCSAAMFRGCTQP